jgi:hypothetical protein
MKPLYKQLEYSIRTQNIKSFENLLNNSNLKIKIIINVFKNNNKFITFNILKSLFSHENYNKDLFSKKKDIEEKIKENNKQEELIKKIGTYSYFFDYYDYMMFFNRTNFIQIINIIINKPELIFQNM